MKWWREIIELSLIADVSLTAEPPREDFRDRLRFDLDGFEILWSEFGLVGVKGTEADIW